MALNDKKYERIFSKTGSDADKITDEELADIKSRFDNNDYIDDKANFSALGPLLYQMQNIVEELDALRTEISNNKDKTGITTSQANAITANTAKTGISDSQADAIAANTKKISFPTCSTNVEESTASITGFAHVYDAKAKSNSLQINVTVTNSKGLSSKYSTTLILK